MEEVKGAVFGMGGERAPGLDGFPTIFSKNLGHSGIGVCRGGRRIQAGFMLKDFSNTFIALIPEEERVSLDDFCPISLCNSV